MPQVEGNSPASPDDRMIQWEAITGEKCSNHQTRPPLWVAKEIHMAPQSAQPPPEGIWYQGEGYQPRPSLLRAAFNLGDILCLRYGESEYGLAEHPNGGLVLAIGGKVLHLKESENNRWGASTEKLAEIPATVRLEFLKAA